ncbi:hypothetical protein ACJMK2_016605 [Sinanodonta woodiana]|uniref:Complex I assembly factor TIMMDC1, mitochondrial n=1 Tax=Sinanodonta woodiana TaxID=1069815 RepID=A0ABD3UU60_SINWO
MDNPVQNAKNKTKFWYVFKQCEQGRSVILHSNTCCLLRNATDLDGRITLRQIIPNTWTVYKNVRAFFSLPRVYASELLMETAVNQPVDVPLSDTDKDIEVAIQKYLAKETPMDRLKDMFSRNHKNDYSDNLIFIYSNTYKAAVFTFLVMATISGVHGKQDFIDRNKASQFRSKFHANRLLMDTIWLYMFRGGFKWSFKVGAFVGSFLLVSQSIATCRNKSSPLEYIIAGGVTGGLMKMNLGLRGFVVGSLVGAVLGLLGGIPIYSALTFGMQTQEEKHYLEVKDKVLYQRHLEKLAGKPSTAFQGISS